MENISLNKSREFAVKIFNLYKYLCVEKHEFMLAKQLLRSGTSIGANLSEAQYSISCKEFILKTKISLKECVETEYWLDLFKKTNLININEYNNIIYDCRELLQLLVASIKTINSNNVV
jgi:four helix bundle protein